MILRQQRLDKLIDLLLLRLSDLLFWTCHKAEPSTLVFFLFDFLNTLSFDDRLHALLCPSH